MKPIRDRGQQLRLLLAVLNELRTWHSVLEIAATIGVTSRTISRTLETIREQIPLEQLRDGRHVRYRLPKNWRKYGTEC